MVNIHCPKCQSEDIELIEYQGGKFLKCNKCKFDESKEMDQYADQKSSQKAKGSFSPYKTGGSQRTKQ